MVINQNDPFCYQSRVTAILLAPDVQYELVLKQISGLYQLKLINQTKING